MPKKTTGSNSAPRATRPHMPGYGLPKGTKGLIPWKWADERLARSHNYWIITVRPDGRPHAAIVWGIWVDGHVYFSTGRQSRKARNLVANPACVLGTENAADAVIVEGRATEITDRARIERLGKPYSKKYKGWTLDPKLGPIFEVRPAIAFGLREKTFKAATRWIFEERE